MDASEIVQRPAVVEALRVTFGDAPIEAIEPLGGGMSGAALFKLTVRGRAYVLRSTGGAMMPAGAEREFACMQVAAERGIAPPVLYASAADRLSISAFVAAPTLAVWLRDGHDVAERLGELLRRLHDGPVFPPFLSVIDASRSFASALAAGGDTSAREALERVTRLLGAMEPHVTLAPCHLDLNPGNILVDRDRLWLVDWELASASDPFHDLVTPGVFSPRLHASRETMLRAYLGREPTSVERARQVLARTLALTFYGLGFRSLARARGLVARPPDGERPSPLVDPAGFGVWLEREAQRESASREVTDALATLG